MSCRLIFGRYVSYQHSMDNLTRIKKINIAQWYDHIYENKNLWHIHLTLKAAINQSLFWFRSVVSLVVLVYLLDFWPNAQLKQHESKHDPIKTKRRTCRRQPQQLLLVRLPDVTAARHRLDRHPPQPGAFTEASAEQPAVCVQRADTNEAFKRHREPQAPR